jgi:hypothetical protein
MPSFQDILDIPAVDTSDVDTPADNQDEVVVDDDSSTDDPTDTTDSDTDDAGDDNADDDTGTSDDDADATPTTDGDGRTLPAKLKEICKQHPDAAKQIKDLYFTNQSLLKYGKPGEIRKMKEAIDAFGSPDEVVKLKQTLDLIGGEQGIQELQSDLEKWTAVDKKYMDGSPEFVDTLIDASPEAFDNMMPTALAKFYSSSPELYNNLMSQVIMNTFIQNGGVNSIKLMKQALATGNTELATQEMENLVGAFGNIAAMAQQAPQPKKSDPKQQQFEQERQTFQQQKMETFMADVTATNVQWTKSTVQKELNTYLKGTKVSDSTFNRLYSAIRDEMLGTLEKNPALIKQWNALKERMDKDGMVRFTKQHMGKILPETVRRVAKEFNLNPGAPKKAVKPGQKVLGKTEAGWKPVSKLPGPDEIDRNKTTDDMIFDGKVITKSGEKLKLV